ncbi:MAG TPA: MMPL family transporter [Nocardioides sp.]|nr:MMPL family transporter [Nocardioides sp.]
MMQRWGAFVARRALAILLAGLALVIGAGAYGFGVFDHLAQGGFDDPDSEAAQELALEREFFGNRTVDAVAIYSSDELTARSPEFRAEVQRIIDRIPQESTSAVVSPYDTRSPELISKDQHAVQVQISLAGDSQDALLDNWDEVEPGLESDRLETDVAGSFAVYGDVNEITSEDLERAEMISLPIVVLLALLIFGSLVAAAMPALVGAFAVVGSLAVVRLLTTFTDVSVFSVNVITLLGMGLAIDYALFVISRFREELAGLPEDDPDAATKAITTTMTTAGRTVLFSGLTVAAAMSSLLVFPQNFLRSMGYGGISAVVIAMLAALTVLPAALRLLGRRIDAGRMPWRRHRPVPVDDENGWWARLARGVMRRPVVVVVVVSAALLLVASPFLDARWGSVDYRVLPEDAAAHQAADKLNSDFGPEQSSANLLLDGVDRQDVAAYTREAEAVDGVTAVQPVATRGDASLLRAFWEGNSQDQRSQDIVRDLRAIEPPDGEAWVGGLTADTVDLITSVGDHLPWMGLIVLLVMLVLLFLAFGSLVLPFKAVAMNIVSITASFGVVTWIFQEGHLSGPLGFESTGYLDSTNPILMLAILFGLSMDYEVFLLSRVREEWDRTHDNDLAVATGLQKTGRIITSAALLLAVVIGAFGLSGIVFMKMIGIGMLVALVIDATVVRALLVPATMKLLGSWNWWAPGPLRRWWERHGWREGDEVSRRGTGERELVDA